MLDKKNIIFIPPLAEELKKLHQDYTEGEDKDLYEVLDVSSLPEANQLIPSLGPALILTSAAKTCAMMLKANKKYLKQFQSKVILVTPQQIPDNTINKLMKVGLNDYVQCPVNEKSLNYKCKLLLKSIKGTQIEEEQPDKNQEKLLSSEFDNVSIDTSSKQRIEKGILEEHERGEIKKNEVEDINLNIISSKMDNKKTRGAMDLKLDFAQENNNPNNLNKSQQSSTDEELELLQKDIQLDLEQAEQQRKQQAVELDIQDIVNTDKQQTEQQTQDSKTVVKKKDSLQLSVDPTSNDDPNTTSDSDNSLLNKPITKQLNIEAKKKQQQSDDNINLQIDNAIEKKSPTAQEQEADELQKIKDELEAELEQDQQQKKTGIILGVESSSDPSSKQSQQESDDNQSSKSHTELQIGKAAKEKSALTEKQQEAKTKLTTKENILTMEKPQRDKKQTTKDQEDDTSRKKIAPEVTLDYGRQKKHKANNEENERQLTQQNIELQIDPEQDELTKKKKKQQDQQQVAKKVNLELEQNQTTNAKRKQQDTNKEGGREVTLQIGKSKKGFTEQVNLDVMKGEGEVEHLDKRMKSRKHHGELKIDFDKKNRGEGDTLDYSKIKKEYKELAHALNSLDPEALKKLKKKKEDKLFAKPQIFEPHPKGVDHLIKIYETYENPLKSSDDVIYAMANILENDFTAMVAIFIYHPTEQQYKERFNNFEDIAKKLNGGQPLGQADKWETIKLVNLEQWQEISQFTWKDETFQSDKQEFLFPYFQDNQKFGFIVIHFNHPIAKNKTGLIETIAESIRGIIIEEYHIALDGGITELAVTPTDSTSPSSPITASSETQPSSPPKKKKGFFSKLFG